MVARLIFTQSMLKEPVRDPGNIASYLSLLYKEILEDVTKGTPPMKLARKKEGKSQASGGIRTHNNLITRHLLNSRATTPALVIKLQYFAFKQN